MSKHTPKITARQIERDYRHRIEADPLTCPVCCGDRLTTDPRYAGRLISGIDVYECQACEVWIPRDEAAAIAKAEGES